MNNRKYAGLFVALLATALAASAQEATAIDLTPVTNGITAAKVAILAAVGIPIAVGMALMSLKWGGRFLVGVMKTLGK